MILKMGFNFMEGSKLKKFVLFCWIFVVGGIFGFVYEELFYRIDLDMWTKRGTTYGPWIPIYAYGAVLIVLVCHKLKKHPILVFLASMLVCGTLEFLTGYVLDRFFDIRLWNYYQEIWNWLNIGGYICLRSVLFFGFSGLFLQYALLPLLQKGITLIKNKTVLCLTVIPFGLFVADIIAFKLKLF